MVVPTPLDDAALARLLARVDIDDKAVDNLLVPVEGLLAPFDRRERTIVLHTLRVAIPAVLKVVGDDVRALVAEVQRLRAENARLLVPAEDLFPLVQEDRDAS